MRRLITVMALLLVVSAGLHAQPRTCIPPGPRVALTFDDGPWPGRTVPILDLLAQHGAVATFFLVGQQVARDPGMARQIWEQGHELGVHTWSHKDMARVSLATRQSEISRGHAAIAQAVPEAVVAWWRAPYGSAPQRGVAIARTYGMEHVLWDVDSLDWQGGSAEVLLHRILGQVHDGSVVLMHEHGRHTVEMLDRLLSALTERGYQMVQVSELAVPTCAAAPAVQAPPVGELAPNLEIIGPAPDAPAPVEGATPNQAPLR